jgi:pimeloyl-ACP methyl ester carboxylesterase
MTATEPEIRPYRLHVPRSLLDDLAARLDRARFVPELPGGGARGVTVERVRSLVERWRTGYDWRAWEARLAAHPQFATTIDGLDVHFLHLRATAGGAFPLLLTHGWPMTVAEYLDLAPRLAGGAVPFDLVIPSIPGFGFSAAPSAPGWDRRRVARAWAELMRRLGYRRYGAHGNDVGGMVSLELARLDPRHVAGVHVTQVFSLPSGAEGELEDLRDDERDDLRASQRFLRERGAYLQLHATQPQTLAHALGDSPTGLLAWHLQLYGPEVDADYILTNATIHWLANTAGPAADVAYAALGADPLPPTDVPIGVATFRDDVFRSIRRLAQRDHPGIVSWHTYDRGGHHPAVTAPDVLAHDLRTFFTPLRT